MFMICTRQAGGRSVGGEEEEQQEEKLGKRYDLHITMSGYIVMCAICRPGRWHGIMKGMQEG
jgi:hypothetical protein